VTAPDGSHHVVAKGLQRFRVLQFLEGYPFTVARVQMIEAEPATGSEIEGRARALKERALETLALLPQVPAEMSAALAAIDDPALLVDVVASVLDIDAPHRGAEGVARCRRAHARVDQRRQPQGLAARADAHDPERARRRRRDGRRARGARPGDHRCADAR